MKQRQTTAIRRFILEAISTKSDEVVQSAASRFGISRQAVNRHIRTLLDEGLVVQKGKTKGSTYELRKLKDKEESFALREGLAEDQVWSSFVRPLLGDLPENVLAVLQHGATEMINNAMDHSEGNFTTVKVEQDAFKTTVTVFDDGIGVFEKIQQEYGFSNKRHILLELAKGKLTTSPDSHSGEGIFFASRACDDFFIVANGLVFSTGPKELSIVAETNRWPKGTAVALEVHNDSPTDLAEVFERYAPPHTHSFSKTDIPLMLALEGDEKLMSRSQAKRVLSRAEKFKEIVLDFKGIDLIGQAFADEIFRVFQTADPDTKITFINASPQVEAMIKRAMPSAPPTP